MTDKKELVLTPELEYIRDLTVDELKEWCEVYGTTKGKNKSELISKIIALPAFNKDQFAYMISARKKLLNFKVTTLSKICEELSETKKGTKKELMIRILRKSPNINLSKYSNLDNESGAIQIEGVKSSPLVAETDKCDCICQKCDDRIKKLEELIGVVIQDLAILKSVIKIDG